MNDAAVDAVDAVDDSGDFPIPMARLKAGRASDRSIRDIIRFGLRSLLAEKDLADVEARAAEHAAFVELLRGSPLAVHAGAANAQHYEVPPEFFELVLGRHLKYSCGYWPDAGGDLDASEERMLELTCERAELRDGQEVLDLGCGWGSFSLYAAERYPRSRFVALSNSAPQRRTIEARAAARGLTNLEVRTANFADFETGERFDRIVSIEMFEHLRNYERALEKVSRWMRDDARLFIHIFTHIRHAYLLEDNWTAENFFTGGMIPSDTLLLHFPRHVRIDGHWRVSGTHYEKTSNAWLARLDARRAEALEIFRRHGRSEDEALTDLVKWRLFFILCAESFGFAGGQEWIVSHYRFARAR